MLVQLLASENNILVIIFKVYSQLSHYYVGYMSQTNMYQMLEAHN